MTNVKNKALISLLLPLTLASGAALAQNSSSFNPNQTKEIQQIIHDYLVKNPQVLIEASQALQQQQMAQMQKTASKAITENARDLFNNSTSPVVGNPNGDVTVVEFMDYQCPHCKEMNPVIDGLIKTDGNLRVVYKELPIFGATSEFAAKAALASIKQGKYQAFHAALMADQNPLSKDEVLKLAREVGLNTDKLSKDAEDTQISQQLKDNNALAQKLGLMGTPAFIVGRRDGSKTAFIPGTTNQQSLQQLITQTRK